VVANLSPNEDLEPENTHVRSGDRQRLQSSKGADDLKVEHASNPSGVSCGIPRLESGEESDQTSRVGAQPARCERLGIEVGRVSDCTLPRLEKYNCSE
jgi:hypothetical protein